MTRQPTHPHRTTRLLALGLALALSTLVVAQWAVNRQINVGGGPPSVRYASSPYTQRINQSATAMMPSQVRYANMRSGALPSEIQMNYRAVGPLAPSGAIAYLPPSPTPSAPRSVTSGNLVNTQSAARPTAAMPGFTMPTAGSVKYAPGPVYQSALTPAASLGVASRTGVPAGQMPYGQTMTGSIRYGSQ